MAYAATDPTPEVIDTCGGRVARTRSPVCLPRRFARMKFLRPHALLCAALVLLPLGGCAIPRLFAPSHLRRGSLMDEDAIKQLVPGTSNRADATSVLGSPTAKATFDDNTWIYYSAVTSTRIGRTPGITQQRVLVLTFDAGGTLRSMQRLGDGDFKEVAMAPGATPSPGSEASFMQQLLGNVGRFSPAGLPGGLGSSGTNPQTGGFGSTVR
jgi:outer membrane protein assembly factor BamE (lipoprotein component of BamABCDE complex)